MTYKIYMDLHIFLPGVAKGSPMTGAEPCDEGHVSDYTDYIS